MKIRFHQETDRKAWDDYVRNHPQGTLYHLSGWKNVIEKTYGHETYYLMAIKDNQEHADLNDKQKDQDNPAAKQNEINADVIVGVLPLVHIKHFVFGNNLVSTPFLDYGGILAKDKNIEKALLAEAIEIGRRLKVRNIELRQIEPLSWLNEINTSNHGDSDLPIICETSTHKVRMLFRLPGNAETLMKSFKSKLRSQIKKPAKEGCIATVGHLEVLNDFYKVFCINMRDLGSPVHTKRLFENVLKEFAEEARICIVYKETEPVATSVIIGYKDMLENPWASSLRKFSRLSPNMLLYFTMLEHGCINEYQYFDFGRCSLEEGTYKFKAQWGSKPIALHWQYVSLNGQQIETGYSEKYRFEKAIHFWKKLPLPVTRILGPSLRKYIAL